MGYIFRLSSDSKYENPYNNRDSNGSHNSPMHMCS